MANGLKAVGLPNRGVVRVTGEDARTFLDGLITNSMAGVCPGQAIHAALLTPQGKIITDFFVTEAPVEDGGGFYCDVPLVAATDLAKRLGFYKLRAKVVIEDISPELGVVAVWSGDCAAGDLSLGFVDPRLPSLGLRVLAHQTQTEALIKELGAEIVAPEDYHTHRASLGVGEAMFDFALGDAFPHEINMDQLHGVDFKKGCYIGQEVISRMQHRGTARTRLIQLAYAGGFNVPEGAPVFAGDKSLGFTGSADKGVGLAMVRLDRVADAVAAGITITAGNVEAKPIRPQWWTAVWPVI
jgi:tRNA-modifying protein YgfZ